MNTLQSKLLTLMIEFDEICRKHGIIYYLSGGSNLGALRHEGFIPWDDDVDIRMPRKEYEKLEAVIDEELRDDRAFLSARRYPGFRGLVPRYMDTTTTSLARGRMSDGTPHGIVIDIIILDPMPVEESRLKEWKKDHYAYCELFESTIVNASRKQDWEYIDAERYRRYDKRAQNEGRAAVLKELEEKLFRIEEEDATHYCMRWGSIWLGITQIDWYGTPRNARFEGHEFYIAEKAELCAYVNYGPEWKYVPDVEARTGHMTLRMMDLASGNCEQEYMQFMDDAHVKEAFENNKRVRVEVLDYKHRIVRDRMRPYETFLAHKIRKKVKENGAEYYASDTDACMELFDDYLNYQMDLVNASNMFYIPLEGKYADLLVGALYKKGKLFKLHKLLGIRARSTDLTPYQKETKSFCDDMMQVMQCLDLREYEKAEELLQAHREKHAANLSVIKASIVIGLAGSRSDDRYVRLQEYIAKALENFPEDGELMKYYGDTVGMLDSEEEAMVWYEKAAANTSNGLILQELKKRNVQCAISNIEEMYEEDDEDGDSKGEE